MTDQTNWAKVLGELLADHELSFTQQIPTVVAEAFARTALPPDLVEQLKSVAEAMSQPMPEPHVEAAPVAPAPQELSRRVAGAIITRTGELAISYSDGSGERLGHVIGPQGEKGVPGDRGEPGIGMQGDAGPPGRDGVSVTAAAINRDGELMLTLSDGTVLTPGRVVAAKRA